MHYLSPYARITKTGDDFYHYVLHDKFRQIDEQVDGPKLLGMLGRESLVDAHGEPLSAEDVLKRLDGTEIGGEIVVAVVQRVA